MAELYAIVGSMERARFMLEGRVPWLQLRFKERPLAPHADEIRGWREAYPDTRVVVNDDLDLAVACNAWGVHLGQEDMARYSVEALRDAPVAVSLSTHSDAEIAAALERDPAMLGFGPIFGTGTKTVAHAPQGVARLAEVVRTVDRPIIAIGGIDGDTMDAVADTGVACVATIGYLERITTPEALQALQQRLVR